MMRFSVGDRVATSTGGKGTVVGVIDNQEYARNLEAWRWSSLTQGLIVLLDDGVFIHIRKPEIDLQRLGEH